MKRVFVIMMSVVLLVLMCVSLAACNPPREEVLKVFLPGNYIDEEYIAENFPAWYKEQTGKNVTVEFITFEKVEDIQRDVEQGGADYDVLCPSDYMVEYLKSVNLLQKVDKNVIDINENGLFKSQYVETCKSFDPTLEYAIPYMYGTLGIVYDYSKTGKHITSWESLFGSEFAGKRSVKKSIHDAYAAACLYNERDALMALSGDAKKAKVQEIFTDYSDATVAAAKSALLSVKSGGAVWDADTIKFKMAENDTTVEVALMWSCDAGYVMNDYEDDDGNECTGNRNLWYVVPEEGGNVYIDAFVISALAVNTEAANYFLKYVSLPEVAIVNSEWAGAISPVTQAYDTLYQKYINNEGGIFDGTPAGWKEMFIETMFPSAETLNRCGVMKDFGDRKNYINNEIWASVIGG